MERLWTIITFLHSLAGPLMTLLYPLYASVIAIESTSKVDDEQWLAYWTQYASVIAIESTSKVDDEQWLAYWILYSFLTLMELLFQPVLEWIPIWYDIKLALVAWLVLPQFRGAAFIYERFVRDKIRQYGIIHRHIQKQDKSSTGKAKTKFMDFVSTKKVS